MILTKTKTFTYDIYMVRKFQNYNEFVTNRKKVNLESPKKCFICKKDFKLTETIYLGMVKAHKNELICEECGEDFNNLEKKL